MNRSLVAVLALLVLSMESIFTLQAAAVTEPRPAEGFLRIRGGAVFTDPGGAPGPGWSAGGALGFPLNRNVSLSLNYDRLYLDVPDSKRVDPVTAQLEFGTANEGGVSPRVEVGAGFYNFGSRGYAVPVPVSLSGFGRAPSRASSSVPFGMSFGGGLSLPMSKRVLFDLDLRYHQTMGFNSLVMGTVGAGLTFKLGGGNAGEWTTAHTNERYHGGH